MNSEDQSYSTTVSREVKISYRAYLPDRYSEEGDAFPLLMFLHGSGERGTDLS
ncbi:MAG: hypothetical protein ACFHX7_18820 [Pseudomonadota bacterium]